MARWSLRAKMRLASVLAAVLMGVAGLSAVDRLVVVNGVSTEMTRVWMPRANLLSEVNTMTSDYRVAEAMHILSLTDDAMAQSEATQAMLRQEIADHLRAYHAFRPSAAMEGRLAAFEWNWDRYVAGNRAMIALSRGNENDKATVLLRESGTAFAVLSTQLLEMIDADNRSVAVASERRDDIYAFSRTLVSVAVVVTILAALGVILFFERRIAAALGRTARSMTRPPPPGPAVV